MNGQRKVAIVEKLVSLLFYRKFSVWFATNIGPLVIKIISKIVKGY